MILTPSQADICRDIHRFRVVCCGRRFGKTVLAIEEIKGYAIVSPGTVAYIAPTIQQARDIAWEMLKKELGMIATYVNESRLEIRVPTIKGDGHSTILVRGWENIETLRGQHFKFIVIDEIASMRNFNLHWQEVIRPTLTDEKGAALFISSPKGFNHFYDLYGMESKDEDYKSFHFSSYDNPHIPREEVDKARMELTEDRFAQEYLADFRKTEGLVYKEFDRTQHLVTMDDALRRTLAATQVLYVAGVDFGYTNPCAVPSIIKDVHDVYWVVDELYRTGMTETQVAEYVAGQNYNYVFPDPEAPSAIAEMRKHGVNVREVVKNKDSIINGINVVRELFKANRLKISSKCMNLIFELETYSYPDDRDGKNLYELPIKSSDHILDGLRYCLMSLENTRVGAKVRTFYPGSANYSVPTTVHRKDAVVSYPKRRYNRT